MIEIWKDIAGYEAYQISSFGRLRRNSRQVRTKFSKTGFRTLSAKPVKICDNGKGYKILCSFIDKKKKNLYIHRLVASHFIPNPHNYQEVNHIDADKSNNHVNNLEWASVVMNRKHAVDNNLVPHGERSPNVKLTKDQVIEILSAHKEYPSINRLALSKKYNVKDTAICRIISGKRWRRVHDEFHSKLKP